MKKPLLKSQFNDAWTVRRVEACDGWPEVLPDVYKDTKTGILFDFIGYIEEQFADYFYRDNKRRGVQINGK